MTNTVLKYGLISGVLVSVMTLLTMPFHDRIGFGPIGMAIGYTIMVLAFLLIYFGVRSYRDNVAGGTVGFGRALTVGLLIGVISSACYVATWEVVYYKYMPNFMDDYTAHEIAKARASGETEEQLAVKKAEMDKFAVMYRNPVYNVAFTLMEPLPVVLIMAFLSAGLVSRRRSDQRMEKA